MTKKAAPKKAALKEAVPYNPYYVGLDGDDGYVSYSEDEHEARRGMYNDDEPVTLSEKRNGKRKRKNQPTKKKNKQGVSTMIWVPPECSEDNDDGY